MKEIGDEIDLNEGGKLIDYAKMDIDYDSHKIQWRIERIAMNNGGELLRFGYWNKENGEEYTWPNRPPALDKEIFIDLLAEAMKKGIL